MVPIESTDFHTARLRKTAWRRASARNDTLTKKGIVMLNSTADIDAAIKRLKSKRSIDASLEADIRGAFREQLEEGTTVNHLGNRRPEPRLGG